MRASSANADVRGRDDGTPHGPTSSTSAANTGSRRTRSATARGYASDGYRSSTGTAGRPGGSRGDGSVFLDVADRADADVGNLGRAISGSASWSKDSTLRADRPAPDPSR